MGTIDDEGDVEESTTSASVREEGSWEPTTDCAPAMESGAPSRPSTTGVTRDAPMSDPTDFLSPVRGLSMSAAAGATTPAVAQVSAPKAPYPPTSTHYYWLPLIWSHLSGQPTHATDATHTTHPLNARRCPRPRPTSPLPSYYRVPPRRRSPQRRRRVTLP